MKVRLWHDDVVIIRHVCAVQTLKHSREQHVLKEQLCDRIRYGHDLLHRASQAIAESDLIPNYSGD